jgi:hypothetical protein
MFNLLIILPFVDLHAAHSKDVSSLHSVRVEFLPANNTSVLQAMDQGIFRSLKQRYCKRLVCRYIQPITNTEETYKVSLCDATIIVGRIIQCCESANLLKQFSEGRALEAHENLNEGYHEISPGTWADVQDKAKVTFTFEEYVQVDDNLVL